MLVFICYVVYKHMYNTKLMDDTTDGKTFESPEVVELNAGGLHLTTLLSTLMRYQESKLADIFRNRSSLPKDKDGRYFLDIDGDVFRHILNFLRCQALPPDDIAMEVQKCAGHLGLEELNRRQSSWGPVFANSMMETWKRNTKGYEGCLNQIREGLSSYNVGSGYFYIQFSDSSMHVLRLCNIAAIADGHQVINVKFHSSKTNRASLMKLLVLDLKKLNIYPDSEEDVFQPDPKCACRIAYRYNAFP